MTKNLQSRLKWGVELLLESELTQQSGAALEELSARLESRRITVAVMGQFKRGKSSLINAMLDKDILPVGIVPITSVVTALHYGQERVVVTHEDGREAEIEMSVLPEYISELGNPGNKRSVRKVDVYLQADLLREIATLVDTPGVGSVNKHNTEATYAYLRESDAIIFVLSVDSPINEIERDFLMAAKEHADKLYFVINKTDLVNQNDLEMYLAYCRALIQKTLNLSEIHLYTISATERSGVDHVLSDILRELKVHGEKILATSVIRKADDELRQSISRIELYLKALMMPVANLEERHHELKRQLGQLDTQTAAAFRDLEMEMEKQVEKIRVNTDLRAAQEMPSLLSKLQAVFEDNIEARPRELERQLAIVLESDLEKSLSVIHQRGVDDLAQSYGLLTSTLNAKLEVIRSHLSSLVTELFQVGYEFSPAAYQLSQRESYFVSVNRSTGSFYVGLSDLIYLLPKARANRMIYESYHEKLAGDMTRNVTNIVYDFRYKMRESLLSANAVFQREVQEIENDLIGLISRVSDEKLRREKDVEQHIMRLRALLDRLRALRSDLTLEDE